MKQILYTHSTDDISSEALRGFFEGWPSPPSPQMHLQILKNSEEVILAIEQENKNVVGFITAITDQVLSAYIPLLEVLPDFRNQGIGRELTKRMLGRLKDLYMIDLLCDSNIQPFYRALGFKEATGMIIRNYQNQAGRKNKRRS